MGHNQIDNFFTGIPHDSTVLRERHLDRVQNPGVRIEPPDRCLPAAAVLPEGFQQEDRQQLPGSTGTEGQPRGRVRTEQQRSAAVEAVSGGAPCGVDGVRN